MTDESQKVYPSLAAWRSEGVKRFGPRFRTWKFICPVCAKINKAKDLSYCLPSFCSNKNCLLYSTNLKPIPDGMGVIVMDEMAPLHLMDFAPADTGRSKK